MNHPVTQWTPDPSQLEVIEATGGSHLVLAPPGCGKTQILTERIRHARLSGVPYTDMLCLTFTNRAARGMQERIGDLLAGSEGVDRLYVGNVHRFCSRFLFDNGVVAAESSVIDEDDAISILAHYLSDDEYAVKVNNTRRREYATVFHLAAFMHQIAHAHPRPLRIHPECVTHEDVFAMRSLCEAARTDFTPQAMTDIYLHTDTYRDLLRSSDLDFGARKASEVLLRKMGLARQYAGYKRENRLLDFEDLLMLTYDALAADTGGRYKRYPWIQVDEVQDLNPLQMAIIDLLTWHPADGEEAPGQPTVMFLGDEQQAIFSFMGAKTDTLSMLRQRCGRQLHRLYENHRSPRYLLEVFNRYAEEVLHIDPALLPRTAYDPPRTGGELCILRSETYESEVRDVARLAGTLAAENPQQTTAIVVSANRDADVLSRALGQQGLSHLKVSGEDLFATPEMKLLLAHLQVLSGEGNFIAWARLLKGLHVFETNTAARNFVRASLDRAIALTDYLQPGSETYVQQFASVYDEATLVVFDTETTGLNVFEDDIVQIAAVKMRQGQLVEGSRFVVFVRSERPVPPMLGEVPNPMVEALRTHELLAPAEALSLFMDYVGDGVLLAHNASFDYHMLDHNLRRHLPAVSLRQRCPRWFDSLKLMRLLEPDMREFKLKHLLEALRLEGRNSHLADEDVEATCGVVRHCRQRAAEALPAQQAFLAQRRVADRAGALRRAYGLFYREALSALYERPEPTAGCRLTGELHRFQAHLQELSLLSGPVHGLDYLAAYVEAELVDTAREPSLYEQLAAHLMELNTLKEADLCNSQSLAERIFVTTVHKAKGLEFDNVVVFDAVDGRYPNHFTRTHAPSLAEDARKFYVAMSRARKRLVVAQSLTRIDYHGYPQPRSLTPFMAPIERYFS